MELIKLTKEQDIELYNAVRENDLLKVKEYIDNGLSVNEEIGYEGSLLLVAMDYNAYNVAEYLIREGANVNYVREKGAFEKRILTTACEHRGESNDMIELLLKNGAKDTNQYEALKRALNLDKFDAIKLIIQYSK